jgi:hypothetical protein
MDINNGIPLQKLSKLTNFVFKQFFLDSSLSLTNLIIQKPET